MNSSANNIVFFDNECVLCGNFLKLLLKIDMKQTLHFASLQSEFSKQFLPAELVDNNDYKTVAFLHNGTVYTYSTAVMHIFGKIGFPWSVLKIGFLFPKKIRDAIYMKVSNNRYSWFGKSSQCIIPDQELQSRFMHEISMP
jgi:predicted DCC family thiol-disulfide oxidoreductase YuxK